MKLVDVDMAATVYHIVACVREELPVLVEIRSMSPSVSLKTMVESPWTCSPSKKATERIAVRVMVAVRSVRWLPEVLV